MCFVLFANSFLEEEIWNRLNFVFKGGKEQNKNVYVCKKIV